MPVLVDFESRSRADLKRRGGRIYWEDPTSEPIVAVLCNTETGEAQVWEPGDATPNLALAVAHNASTFDRHAARASGWQVDRWLDSSQAARRAGLPGKLDAMAKRWLGRPKDDTGSKLTKSLSRASRAKKTFGQLPEITPEIRQRVTAYCVDDVSVMVDAWPTLEPWFEVDADVAQADAAINERGIALDTELVKAMLAAVERDQELLCEQTANGLGGGWTPALVRDAAMSPAQLCKIIGLPNAQAKTLDDIARAQGDKTHPLIRVRRALASIVPGKLRAALERVSPDGRLRDSHHYYGAHTGRWSSKGMQHHNLPRVGFEDAAHKIGWSVGDYLEALVDGVMAGATLEKDQMAGLMRAVLTASPGKTLCVLDYSGIEARCLVWAARDTKALDVYRAYDAKRGPDPYCVMATTIFSREILKKQHPTERNVGKQAELGCFAADTLVLTDRGYVPIVCVRPSDMVWDGVEWVQHGGLLDQGFREVVGLAGVLATPNHRVLSERWTTWGALAESASTLCQALEIGSANLPSSVISEGLAAVCRASLCDAAAAIESTPRTPTTSSPAERRAATDAPSSHPARPENGSGATPTCARTTNTGHDYCLASHRSCSGATTPATRRTRTTAGEASRCTDRGGQTARPFSGIYSLCPAGMIPRSISTGSTTTPATCRVTCASSRPERTSRTARPCASSEPASPTLRRVYDIMNAGPRHRFTILTDHGPLIVHNCGYGMGANKFSDTCDKAGVDLVAAGVDADDVVQAWRKMHAPVVKLWRDCEHAFAAACNGKRAAAGPWVYEPHDAASGNGLDVWCVLPGGRPIVYAEARATRDRRGWDLSYQGHLFRDHVYGGLLVENAVQATCRDFLADALVRFERDGLDPVLHVHDEGVCEVDEALGDEGLEYMREIMSDVPEWADGLPIVLDGFTGRRYRK